MLRVYVYTCLITDGGSEDLTRIDDGRVGTIIFSHVSTVDNVGWACLCKICTIFSDKFSLSLSFSLSPTNMHFGLCHTVKDCTGHCGF